MVNARTANFGVAARCASDRLWFLNPQLLLRMHRSVSQPHLQFPSPLTCSVKVEREIAFVADRLNAKAQGTSGDDPQGGEQQITLHPALNTNFSSMTRNSGTTLYPSKSRAHKRGQIENGQTEERNHRPRTIKYLGQPLLMHAKTLDTKTTELLFLLVPQGTGDVQRSPAPSQV